MFAGGLPHHYATLRSGELFGLMTLEIKSLVVAKNIPSKSLLCFGLYFTSDSPVILSGCEIPIIFKTVGARAVRSDSAISGCTHSPHRIIQHGTGFCVCAVSGFSGVPIRSQLP